MKGVAIVKYLFLAVGIGLIAGALYWAQDIRGWVTQSRTARGEVIDLVRSSNSNTYAPVIRFVTAADETIEFTSSVSSNPPGYAKGESVEVLYLPGAPHEARIRGFVYLWLGPIILGGIGSVFLLIGGCILLAATFKARRRARLRQFGTPILSTLQSVELDTSLSVNGRHPFRVYTQWMNPATSEIHVFASDNLWFDPSAYLTNREITVWIESGNPKSYHVDLSFLPKLAE